MGTTSVSMTLYYTSSGKYSSHIEDLLKDCGQIANDCKVSFASIEWSTLDESEKSEIVNKIRSIIPQRRGTIVSSGHFVLPLSGSKKLNLQNTPVIMIESEREGALVFPCKIEETYYSLEKGAQLLKESLPHLPQLRGVGEGGIASFILREPGLIEEGLRDPGVEVEIPGGKIDLLFTDHAGMKLLVEVEREARDAALGQIIRLCAAYEKKFSLPRESVRGMILCMEASDSVREAAERSRIEIKIMKPDSIHLA